jgi:hypothetical protein
MMSCPFPPFPPTHAEDDAEEPFTHRAGPNPLRRDRGSLPQRCRFVVQELVARPQELVGQATGPSRQLHSQPETRLRRQGPLPEPQSHAGARSPRWSPSRRGRTPPGPTDRQQVLGELDLERVDVDVRSKVCREVPADAGGVAGNCVHGGPCSGLGLGKARGQPCHDDRVLLRGTVPALTDLRNEAVDGPAVVGDKQGTELCGGPDRPVLQEVPDPLRTVRVAQERGRELAAALVGERAP